MDHETEKKLGEIAWSVVSPNDFQKMKKALIEAYAMGGREANSEYHRGYKDGLADQKSDESSHAAWVNHNLITERNEAKMRFADLKNKHEILELQYNSMMNDRDKLQLELNEARRHIETVANQRNEWQRKFNQLRGKISQLYKEAYPT